MPDSGQLFAVTTRSHLKGPWFFPAMMLATRQIRRQLQDSPDVVRWASVIAAPTEFWTITVWRSRHDMNEFAQSGAHDEIMWRFSKWLDSFWLMRWRPGSLELGDWDGLSMAQPEPARQGTAVARPELQEALEYLPRLKASTDATGRATYEASPAVRRQRAEVAGARAVVVHVHSGGLRPRAGLRALRRLRTSLAREEEDLLRAVVGFGKARDAYLLSVWQGQDGAHRFLDSSRLAEVLARWPGESWSCEWLPENEFGHWDGLRLRRNRNKHGLRVPKGAQQAADMPSEGKSR